MNAPVPPHTTVELTLEGMTCAACAARIEKVLNKLPGVVASVNFAAETAHVHYDAAATTGDDLVAAVRRAGYDAHPRHDSATEKQLKLGEYRRELRRFWIAALLTLPLLAQMGIMFTGNDHEVLPRWLQLALATPVQFWIGARFYTGAWHALRGGGANMDVLIALGTSMAFVFSAVVTLLGLHHQHVYFEASAAIITLVLMGKLLEARAKARTSAAIEALIKLQPKIARVERNGTAVEVTVDSITIGEIFVVRAGESIPVDGVVIEGESNVNEAMLTGESLPVAKATGAKVFAATLNQQGLLRCRATGVGAHTILAGIIRLVEQAQGSKAPVQRLADAISGIFVPVVVGLSALTFVVWWLFGDFNQALVDAVAVLVIACPCALGLATPTAIMVGTGRGARAGILVRNAAALERAEKIQVLVVDKTGTLTEGRPVVIDVLALRGDERQLLQLAATLEQGSQHPLARALLARAEQEGVAAGALRDFESVAGKGVRGATGDSRRLTLGSPDFLAEQVSALERSDIEPWLAAGKTVIGVADSIGVIGWIAIADRLRDSSVKAVARLQAAGIEVVMLTGDNEGTARFIARAAGITTWQAGVMPQHKAEAVQRYKREGKVVGMVGDGVNDAPALAAADVSFAIGAGSDVAIEAADITLMRDDMNSVADAILLSRATLGKIRQNLFFAFFYNVLGIPLAALGMLNPVIAGAAMALSSVTVVSNSLLLNRWKPGR